MKKDRIKQQLDHLSNAILKGSKKIPKQGKKFFSFHGPNSTKPYAACAIGAAFYSEASPSLSRMFALEDSVEIEKPILNVFPILTYELILPEQVGHSYLKGNKVSLGDLILYMNDNQKWSRPNIAKYIKKLDSSLFH